MGTARNVNKAAPLLMVIYGGPCINQLVPALRRIQSVVNAISKIYDIPYKPLASVYLGRALQRSEPARRRLERLDNKVHVVTM